MQAVPYKEAVGALLYLACCTRPDIAAATSVVCRFSADPGQQHWAAVKRIFRYLKGTSKRGIALGGLNPILQGFSDASWADNPDNRRSTIGYIFLFGSGPIAWKSRLQQSAALSSMESEFMALTNATQEAMWIRRFLAELGFTAEQPTTIYEDNQGCIKFVSDCRLSSRSKHIAVRQSFIHEAIQAREVTLQYQPTKEMVADMLTKALPPTLFQKHRDVVTTDLSSSGSVSVP
jgi:hypothetical protein